MKLHTFAMANSGDEAEDEDAMTPQVAKVATASLEAGLGRRCREKVGKKLILEAIATRVDWEAIASRLEAIASNLILR